MKVHTSVPIKGLFLPSYHWSHWLINKHFH